MRIERFVFGSAGANCYVVRNEDTRECFVVDLPLCPPELVGHIKKEGLAVQAVLLTHGHVDHILGISDFLKEFPVPVYAHAEEEEFLNDPNMNLSVNYDGSYIFKDAEYLKYNRVISLAGYKIHVIHTPGHTPGGCCYYIPSEKVVFTGDTLFQNSIGRSDFPAGDGEELIRSIRENLLVLPDDTKVYPGHMDETTIAFEKAHNPFL